MDDFSVIPLGTVSPYCKGNKNCPGFLVQNGNCKLLLDCGPGILKNFDYTKDLNNLVIIISHLHHDHYAGLLELAYGSYVHHRLGNLKNKIKVFIPEEEEKTKDVYNLLNHMAENYLEFTTYSDRTKFNYGNMNISFLLNPHNIKTYSTKVKVGDKTFVYSSDTGYAFDHLDLFAEKADLLVCESSFVTEQDKPDGIMHLSAFEAGMIAMSADVKLLALTHFFPEIDKNEYVKESQKMFENVVAAEEGKKLVLK